MNLRRWFRMRREHVQSRAEAERLLALARLLDPSIFAKVTESRRCRIVNNFSDILTRVIRGDETDGW